MVFSMELQVQASVTPGSRILCGKLKLDKKLFIISNLIVFACVRNCESQNEAKGGSCFSAPCGESGAACVHAWGSPGPSEGA